MRQQCHGAFKQLLHYCQPKSFSLDVYCRRVASLSLRHHHHQQHTSYATTTTNYANNRLRLSPNHREYSKFSTHLSAERAMELICNLQEDERHNLRDAMFKMEADKEKKLYESQLAVGNWRTRFGRLSTEPSLGQVDPSGTFCAVPDDWLRKKLVQMATPPSAGELYKIFFVNAVPFIAFGFLDNFIMIMAGEYIEYALGHFITLSTMAAAGLGNTLSDIMGITMAAYVENGCQALGLKAPKLTPAQFELKSSKNASTWGRIFGITLGCLLGMCPLWFLNDNPETATVTATTTTSSTTSPSSD